jgi:hypothetical protein
MAQVANNWGFINPNQKQYVDMLNEATNKKYTEANQGITSAEHDFNQQRAKELQALKNAMFSATSEHVQSNGSAGQLAATLGQLAQQTNNQINENAQALQQQRIQNEAAKAAELAANPETALNAINGIRNTLAQLGLTQYANDIQKQTSNQSGANTFIEGATNRDGMIGYSSKSAEIQAGASNYATDVGAQMQQKQIDSNERMHAAGLESSEKMNKQNYSGNPTDNQTETEVTDADVAMINHQAVTKSMNSSYTTGNAADYIKWRVEYEKSINNNVSGDTIKGYLKSDGTFNANVRKTKGTKLTEDERTVIENIGNASNKLIEKNGKYYRGSWKGTYDYNTGRPTGWTLEETKNPSSMSDDFGVL